jgi:RecA/RadA recombinase
MESRTEGTQMKSEGDYAPVTRIPTGLYSLDRALSGTKQREDGTLETLLGWPMTIYEVFGNKDVGKSTFSTSIAGIVAKELQKDIVYAPVEHVDRDLLESILMSVDFDGLVSVLGGRDMVRKFIPTLKMGKEEIVTDEILGDCWVEALRRDEYVFGIFDSLSAVSPIEEAESSSADKNMGRRARLSGVWARKIVQSSRFRENGLCPSVIFITHNSTVMGNATNTGTSTSGGEVKKNLSKARIKLRKMPEPTMTEQDRNAYVIEGLVEQFNFGIEKKKFYCVILGGKGIHRGLTAVYDCKMLGLASFGKSVTLGGEKYGAMRTLVAKAHEQEDEFFQPFIDALKNPSKVGKAVVEDEDALEAWEESAE